MVFYRNKGIFSSIFLILILFINITNIIFNDFLFNFLKLNSQLILHNFELWRILTFPVIFSNFESFLLFAFTFIIVSPKLERIIDTFRYPVWLFMVSILQGLTVTLIFWKSNISLVGFDGISIFILALYSFLEPKSKLNLTKNVRINIAALNLLVIFGWLVFNINNTGIMNLSSLMPELVSVFACLIFATLIFVQVKINQIIYNKKRKDLMNQFDIPKPEELSMALMQSLRAKKAYNSSIEDEYTNTLLTDDPDENEDKLNDILDKIHSNGKESLSIQEKNFLIEYSNSLK